jgi:hypothetical protein
MARTPVQTSSTASLDTYHIFRGVGYASLGICMPPTGPFEVGRIEPSSAMAFLKSLTDVPSSEHWTDRARPLDILDEFLANLSKDDGTELARAVNSTSSMESRDSPCCFRTHELRPTSRLGSRMELGRVFWPASTAMEARDFLLGSKREV